MKMYEANRKTHGYQTLPCVLEAPGTKRYQFEVEDSLASSGAAVASHSPKSRTWEIMNLVYDIYIYHGGYI